MEYCCIVFDFIPTLTYEISMRFELRTTEDGSSTVYDHEVNECFKSSHAAQTEAEWVFFRPGILENPWLQSAAPFRVLELGLGLGTNFLHLEAKNLPIEFTTIERDTQGLEYYLKCHPSSKLKEFLATKAYRSGPFSAQLILDDFQSALDDLPPLAKFHCIYFDPFSPTKNPDSWTPDFFRKVAARMEPGAHLVTYSVSRIAKDGALAAGLSIEKRSLPPILHKRSSLLARKE